MRLVIALMLLCLAGCAKDLTPGLVGCAEDRSPREDCGKEPTANEHNLTEPKITYLGVGGWLLNWHGNGLLLAPSFSNPNVPIFVRANEQRIADYLPDVKNVKVLLIGHAHYDHLLDVPVIMQRYAPDAIAYGNRTAGPACCRVRQGLCSSRPPKGGVFQSQTRNQVLNSVLDAPLHLLRNGSLGRGRKPLHKPAWKDAPT
ncbi:MULTISPECIES: hypothetical protein [Pseudomonas]|uniref:hypothetical protein n=1 Tax=Pseudomonas TaxID=286 RepID=UPI000A5127B6|nr:MULTISPECIES: hypothetical protein [Pseudomonas]